MAELQSWNMASAPFHPVDVKLHALTEMYEKLREAQSRLKGFHSRADTVPVELLHEIIELERLCGVALDELNAAYAKSQTKPDPPDGS